MPIAALLARYGPALWAAGVRYGPTALGWIERAAADGTLERDLGRLVETLRDLAPLLGRLGSLGDLVEVAADAANALDVRPGQPEDPAMERAAGPRHGGR